MSSSHQSKGKAPIESPNHGDDRAYLEDDNYLLGVDFESDFEDEAGSIWRRLHWISYSDANTPVGRRTRVLKKKGSRETGGDEGTPVVGPGSVDCDSVWWSLRGSSDTPFIALRRSEVANIVSPMRPPMLELPSSDPPTVGASSPPTILLVHRKTTKPKRRGKRQRGGDDELHSFISEKVARALAAQCALPADLMRLKGLEEESFFDHTDIGLLMLVSAHNDTRRWVRESWELVTTLTEDLKAEKDIAIVAMRSDDMLLHQFDLIMAKLRSRFPDEDGGFVSQIDAYQNLNDEEEVAGEVDVSGGVMQDSVRDVPLGFGGDPKVSNILELAILTDSSVIEAEPTFIFCLGMLSYSFKM
ncbi:hypothetical protein JCGZ_13098 [Jatropha curcas]|uniref:Uncharacterized protein n=1 Tax=Jatropha curcas TaxID=180498 RepID=A0A067KE60_JATCU|nr:hypothetical protein JCGZ_13098 [Jatropha curcas]